MARSSASGTTVPIVIETSASQRQADGSAARPDRLTFCSTTSATPPSQQQAQPLLDENALTEQRNGRERGEDGLQTDDQGHQPGRHAEMDGGENAAQVSAVSSTPDTAMWATSRGDFGHGTPNRSAIGSMSATTSAKRSSRKVIGVREAIRTWRQ